MGNSPAPPRLLGKRARVVLAITAAVLLLGAGERGVAEEEPVARAPLPPPPGTASEPDMPQSEVPAHASASKRSQTDADHPTLKFHPPIMKAAPKNRAGSAPAHRGTAAAAAGNAPAKSRGSVATKAPRPRPRSGIAFEGGTPPSRFPPGPAVGHLSPAAGDLSSRAESPATAPTEPPADRFPYYNPPPGMPAYGHVPAYSLYPWQPPGSGFYR